MTQSLSSRSLISPSKCLLDEKTGLCELFFHRGLSIAPSGVYWVRGGVCWPRVEEDGIRGYAVLCGRHEASGRVYVFEETEFSVVDLVRDDETGEVKNYAALGPWLNECWRKYYANTFYWHQEPFSNKRHLIKALRSPMIQPKPVLPEIAWQDDLQALAEVYLLDGGQMLTYDDDDGVKAAIQAHETTMFKPERERIIQPALHALQCAVVGLDRKPRGNNR